MIASGLSWVWGVLLATLAMIIFTLGFHVPAAQRSSGDLLVLTIISVVYCYLGYGLRRGRRAAVHIALVTTCLVSLLTLIGLIGEGRLALLVGLLVNLILLGLVLTGQRQLRGNRAEQVGV